MTKIPAVIIAATALVLGALVARRLIMQAESQAGLAPGTGTRGQPAPAPPAPVSTAAARSAARSLPGTREELYRQAARMGVRGRSRMNKRQLHEAVQRGSNGGGA